MAFSMAASMGGYMAEKQREIIKIDIDNIIEDENNDFEVEGSVEIETKNDLLKDSIEQFGLLDPCTVRPAGDGSYKLISGHRRTLMHRRLAEEGKEKFRKVDCIILNTDETGAEQILLEANIPNRQISDWEKARAVERMTQIFEQRKAAGEEITGRRREHIAKALGMSTSAVGRLENINKNLTPEYKDELKSGSIGVSVADKIASKPAEEQKKMFDAKGAKVKLYDLNPDEPEANPSSTEETPKEEGMKVWREQVPVKKKFGVEIEITIKLLEAKRYRASVYWQNKKNQSGGGDPVGEYETYYTARAAAIKCAAGHDKQVDAALAEAGLIDIDMPRQDGTEAEGEEDDTDIQLYARKIVVDELDKLRSAYEKMITEDIQAGNKDGERNRRAVISYIDELHDKTVEGMNQLKGSDLFAE